MANGVSKRDRWLDELEMFLMRSLGEEGTPVFDVRWFLLRVKDTKDYRGQIRDASFRDLSKDLVGLDEEYPSFLPAHLLAPPEEE